MGDDWKIVFSPTPSQPYDWEGIIGDMINLNVSASIVEVEQESSDPAIPYIPVPKPLFTNIEVNADIDEFYYDYGLSSDKESASFSISNVDSMLFFPYDDIKYYKNDEPYSVDFAEELYDGSGNKVFDFITSFVPSKKRSITYTITITAYANNEEDTSDISASSTYTIFIENDWDRSAQIMEDLMAENEEYFDSQSEPTEDLEPPSRPNLGANESDISLIDTDAPPPPKKKPTGKKGFMDGMSLDGIFKGGIDDNINIFALGVSTEALDSIQYGKGKKEEPNEIEDKTLNTTKDDESSVSMDKLIDDPESGLSNATDFIKNSDSFNLDELMKNIRR